MTTIKNFFRALWLRLFYSKREKTYDDILLQLNRALENKKRNQWLLERDMRKHLKKYIQADDNAVVDATRVSKFIPLDHMSKFQLRTLIDKKFGERLKKWDMEVTDEFIIMKR